jgi:hypothetical protein
MTSGPVAAPGIDRERRLASLRAALGQRDGVPVGPGQPPARAPFGGRRSSVLAGRLAEAIGAELLTSSRGTLVRRVLAPRLLPVDRRRLAGLPGQPPPQAPLVCLDTETTGLATAAGTLAFLVGLGRWDGDVFHEVQLLLPDHADEPALLDELSRWVTPDAWLVTYNGRGFDWPLIEARYRLAGHPAPEHGGHLDLLPLVRRLFRHRLEDAKLRTVESSLLGVRRVGDVGGWEIPGIYLDVLRGGPIEPLAAVILHNELDVRSLGLLLAHVERGYADRADRVRAPRGDLAGLARAFDRDGRHEQALDCIDDALAAPAALSDPFGRGTVDPRPERPDPMDRDREPWWSPRVRPDFGGRAPHAGWRGALAGGRGGPLGPSPGIGSWSAGDTWTDERLAAERARILRRLGRWSEAAEAWRAAATCGGALGAIAWIEVAKIREHRLDDAAGALEATRAAWRIAERSRVLGRPLPRVEADLAGRARRLSRRLRRAGTITSSARRTAPQG